MDQLDAVLATIEQRLSFVKTDPIDWRQLVLGFSWVVCLWESYLLLRQYPLYSKREPPPALAKYFNADVFAKSQDYGRDKAKFSAFSNFYRLVFETLQLQSSTFYPWAWDMSGRTLALVGYGPEYKISQSVVFGLLLMFISMIISLPLGIYQTFVLEEKHGFNKTTPGLYVADTIKGALLGVALGGPFLAAFLYVFDWAGDRFLPYLMTLLFTFQMVMVIIFPTFIQPLFNKLSPLPSGELRTRIEALAGKLRFPLKHLYEIDGSKRSSHSNAYFYGLPWSKHIVVFDTLIKQSKPDEVEAVLAHELGHWYYQHPTQFMLVSQLHIFTILAAFPAFRHSAPLMRSFGFSEPIAANPPAILSFLLYQMVLTPAEAILGMLLNAVSRRFEYQADRFACELPTRLKDDDMRGVGARLGRALIRLHVENLSTIWVDWLYSAYHHSHPTLTERLRALERYGGEPLDKAAKDEL
ncbi:peptidase family M48-domain-containing protein [Vararia minispora EC-137]|uniref:Peptidase family M48-domain-containing protein n=1 Tax=Vararia minispora EC-137 TaxID=1314806 RepID=A0ACB8QNU5_9AGAM|nr:peptidase family M48-domain-containing protein [Vararia minispora EC-137]